MNPLFRLLLLSCLLATGCLPSLPCDSGECQLALIPSFLASLTGASQQANVATILPASGYYDSEITVSMSHPDPGATLYYTTDGTTPTTFSTVYATPFVLPDSGLAEVVTVKVLAVLSDGSIDPVQSPHTVDSAFSMPWEQRVVIQATSIIRNGLESVVAITSSFRKPTISLALTATCPMARSTSCGDRT